MKMQTSHSQRQRGTHCHAARGTFQPCSLLAVVSNMLFVTVLAMVYLRFYSNQRFYLRKLDSNLLVSVSNILRVTVYWQLNRLPAFVFQSAGLPAAIGFQSARTR